VAGVPTAIKLDLVPPNAPRTTSPKSPFLKFPRPDPPAMVLRLGAAVSAAAPRRPGRQCRPGRLRNQTIASAFWPQRVSPRGNSRRSGRLHRLLVAQGRESSSHVLRSPSLSLPKADTPARRCTVSKIAQGEKVTALSSEVRTADHQDSERSKPKGSRPREVRAALMLGICVTRHLRPYCTPCSRCTA